MTGNASEARRTAARMTVALLLAAFAVILPSGAAAPTQTSQTSRLALADPLATTGRGAGPLVITVRGHRLGRPATVVVRGVRGRARGMRQVVPVRDSVTLRNLPTGRYRLSAKVIEAPAAPGTRPLLQDYPRTSAASRPVRRVRIRQHEPATVGFRFPSPPRLPANFTGQGRYIVRDLGVDVPFTWNARHGDMQMVAGGRGQPIHFTNLIKNHVLYTKTYTWPGVDGVGACLATGPWDRGFLNQWFAASRFVGPVTLHQPRRQVNHWRAGLVFSLDPQPGNHLRAPIASADVFVARGRSSTFWNIQHFGFQNLLDPQLDEWIQMRTFEHRPGRLNPPRDCVSS